MIVFCLLSSLAQAQQVMMGELTGYVHAGWLHAGIFSSDGHRGCMVAVLERRSGRYLAVYEFDECVAMNLQSCSWMDNCIELQGASTSIDPRADWLGVFLLNNHGTLDVKWRQGFGWSAPPHPPSNSPGGISLRFRTDVNSFPTLTSYMPTIDFFSSTRWPLSAVLVCHAVTSRAATHYVFLWDRFAARLDFGGVQVCPDPYLGLVP